RQRRHPAGYPCVSGYVCKWLGTVLDIDGELSLRSGAGKPQQRALYEPGRDFSLKAGQAAIAQGQDGEEFVTNPLFDQLVKPLAVRDGVFLIDASGNEISGKAFYETAMSFASALSQLGMKPGDRMAVQVEKTPEALALYCAALAAGVIFLPLNTAYTADEVAYFVGDSGASLLVGDPSKESTLRQVASSNGALFATLDASGSGSLRDKASEAGTDFQPVPRSSNDLAAILYTSGTTGRSKGAML